MLKGFKLLLFTTSLLCSVPSWGTESSGLSLGVFRVAQLSMFQSGGNCFTGIVDWAPAFHLNSTFGIRASLGGSLIKTRLNEKKPLYEALGFLAYSPNSSLSLELGGGLTIFDGNGGTRTSAGGNGVFLLNNPILVFRHLYVGYLAVFVPTNLTHEIRAGVGTSF